jgi:hypothetical protein
VIMSPLSARGRALVRAGQRAFQPTEADRVRLLGALSFRLVPLPCRPTWVRCRPRPTHPAIRRRGWTLLGTRSP